MGNNNQTKELFLRNIKEMPGIIVVYNYSIEAKQILLGLNCLEIKVDYICVSNLKEKVSALFDVDVIHKDILVEIKEKKNVHIVIAGNLSEEIKNELIQKMLDSKLIFYEELDLAKDGIFYWKQFDKYIVHTNIFKWLDTKPVHLKSVLHKLLEDDTYTSDVFRLPSIRNYGDLIVLDDFKSKYVNVINGRRVTTDLPEKSNSKIYLYGDSRLFGFGNEDYHTIASYLQRKINIDMNQEYSIVNCGVPNATIMHMYNLMRNDKIGKKDMVIFIGGVDSLFEEMEFENSALTIEAYTFLQFSFLLRTSNYIKNIGSELYYFQVGEVDCISNPSPNEKFLQNFISFSKINFKSKKINQLKEVPQIKVDSKLMELLSISNGIKTFNISDIFQRPHQYGEIFIDSGHIGSIGNELIGNKIFDIIKLNLSLNKSLSNEITEGTSKLRNYIQLTFLENYKAAYLDSFLENLSREAEGKPENSGVIVMNCNPFTKGHKYLIEKSLEYVDYLYVIVLEENKSDYSFKDRFLMVKEGTKEIKKVSVLSGGLFVASSLTFPAYFDKSTEPTSTINATEDIELFLRYIVPILKIKKRFLGMEPYCTVTNAYNNLLMERLPENGVDVIVIDRLKNDGIAISASNVRILISNGNNNKLREVLPDTTFNYLLKEKYIK